MTEIRKIDLHMHSTHSDGSDTPEELLEKIRENQIDCFALTDHDAFGGCREIMEMLVPGDPLFIPGVEFGCKYPTSDELTQEQNIILKGKYHILGYQYDMKQPVIQKMVQEAHDIRMNKMYDRFQFLIDKYHYRFEQEHIEKMKEYSNPGRPHFAKMLVKLGLVSDYQMAYEQLETYPGYHRVISPEKAVQSIRQAGGIPVLAHAPFGDGGQDLGLQEIEARVSYLKECGLMGLECFYSGFSQDDSEMMLSLAKKYDLLVTCGSDYHGRVKKVKLAENQNPDIELIQPFLNAVKERR